MKEKPQPGKLPVVDRHHPAEGQSIRFPGLRCLVMTQWVGGQKAIFRGALVKIGQKVLARVLSLEVKSRRVRSPCRSGEPLQNSPRASCCRTRMASPTGKRPLENETDTDTLYPATRPVQENDDESDANDAESPESHRGFGRKMARLLCSQVGCESLAAMGGLCKRHNPGCHCTIPGCNLVAYTKKLCRNHGAEVKPRSPCRQGGCGKPSVKAGVCWEHLRHDQKHKKCIVEGCTSQARRKGVCTKHGAKQTLKICAIEGCSLTVRKGGMCGQHFTGPQGEAIKRTKRICDNENCTNQAYIGGLCRSHGKRCSHMYCEKTVYR